MSKYDEMNEKADAIIRGWKMDEYTCVAKEVLIKLIEKKAHAYNIYLEMSSQRTEHFVKVSKTNLLPVLNWFKHTDVFMVRMNEKRNLYIVPTPSDFSIRHAEDPTHLFAGRK